MENLTKPHYRIHVTETADDPDRAFVRRQLHLFNVAALPQVFPESGVLPCMTVIARDAVGQVVGGVVAEIHWTSLQIDYLWVHESQRGHGLGQTLLRQAEAAGRARGCTWAGLTTYDFQARGFYEKLGYRVVGEQTDYPPGHSYYWLRHDFEAESGNEANGAHSGS